MTNTFEPRTRPMGTWMVIASGFTVLAVFALGLNAQDPKIIDKPEPAKKLEDKQVKPTSMEAGGEAITPSYSTRRGYEYPARASLDVAGYTRPGNPDDQVASDGRILPAAAFSGQGLQRFKIMGGTVYFAVFKNTGAEDGDTYGTGLSNIDHHFQEGRSFTNSFSPRYDRRAKYLYLYQVVNDRALDPRNREAPKGAKSDVITAEVTPKDNARVESKIPEAEPIASLAVKLLVDPRYITSWGHFTGSGFAANVVDTNSSGRPIKQVAFEDGRKVEREKEIRLAFSYNPAIEMNIPQPQFSRHSRSFPLDGLSSGFGVDSATRNLRTSKAADDLKLVAAEMSKEGIKLASHVEGRMKATQSANDPDYVQIMYLNPEERVAPRVNNVSNGTDDEVTRAIFRVDWRQANVLKQGEHSVVVGFTTDLPPVNAPVRLDTPTAAVRSEGLRLANYFAESAVDRATGAAEGAGTAPATGEGIVPTAAGAAGAALALSVGTALGQAPTPVPAPAAAPAAAGGGGFAGVTGGLASLGGGTGGGVSGGIGIPSLTGGGFARPSGSSGGGGGTPTTGTSTSPGNGESNGTNTGNGTNNNNNNINFDASLTNQQQQKQFQQQQQFQHQHQHQHQHQGQHQHQHGGGGGGGNVVPAPPSLLLGLLGLPGLFLLRRRKSEALPPC